MGQPAARPAQAPVETSLRQAAVRPAVSGQGNLNVPTYLRAGSPVSAAPSLGNGHNPGEDDFVFFDEDELETPSFLRKQAN